jgi:hypothetical protein
MKKNILLIVFCFVLGNNLHAQKILKLDDILDNVLHSYPSLKMYDAEIQSLDAAAKRSFKAASLSSLVTDDIACI